MGKRPNKEHLEHRSANALVDSSFNPSGPLYGADTAGILRSEKQHHVGARDEKSNSRSIVDEDPVFTGIHQHLNDDKLR